jgi:hypothetical protein
MKELDATHRTWKEKLEVVWEMVDKHRADMGFK